MIYLNFKIYHFIQIINYEENYNIWLILHISPLPHVEKKIAMFVRCAAMLVHASMVEHAHFVTFEQRARYKNFM